MSKNLKSLMSGALKCGASQFKANIPSVNGVTLAPATTNPVNFVFEITKSGADDFLTKLTAASIPHYVEEYTQENVLMNRIYAAIPEEENYFDAADLFFKFPVNVFCYTSGNMPLTWMGDMFRTGSQGSTLFFVNEVELEGMLPFLMTDAPVTVIFMKDVKNAGRLELAPSSTLIFNGTVLGAAVELYNIDPDTNTTVVLAPQPDDVHIEPGSFEGNIRNLYYAGEWNQTTREWFGGEIYNLNGEPLDPQP